MDRVKMILLIIGTVMVLFFIVYIVSPIGVPLGTIDNYFVDSQSSTQHSKAGFYTEFLEILLGNRDGEESSEGDNKDSEDSRYDNKNDVDDDDKGKNEGGGEGEGSGEDTLMWFALCKKIYTDWQAAGFSYGLGKKEIYKGTKVRIDCSGYLSMCLYIYGMINNPMGVTSATIDNVLSGKDGIQKVFDHNPSNLREGDILVYSGHVEVFAYDAGNSSTPFVYNWGSVETVTTKTPPTRSGHTYSEIKSVWRIG